MKKYLAILTLLLTLSINSYGQDIAVIPNIFTPNNDGVNDVFMIETNGVEELTVSIYNRYGGLIYRYFGLKGTWDGYTHAGELCSPGVYFVIAEFTLPDGSKIIQDENVQIIL